MLYCHNAVCCHTGFNCAEVGYIQLSVVSLSVDTLSVIIMSAVLLSIVYKLLEAYNYQ
jgi:hypothetical protein